MHDHEQVRKQLIVERKALFRRAANTEDDLLWLETDVESEFHERGQPAADETETKARALDRHMPHGMML